MRLDRIIKNSGASIVEGSGSIDITSICSDSRKVTAGAAFIAVKGFASDGHDYIPMALGKGARVIVYEDQKRFDSLGLHPEQTEGAVFVKTDSARHTLAIMAANFYDNPSEKLTLVGITGTNGKTTTVTLLHRMFTAMGYSCGLLSTIANDVGTKGTEAVNTTSDPITINSMLAAVVSESHEHPVKQCHGSRFSVCTCNRNDSAFCKIICKFNFTPNSNTFITHCIHHR